MATYNATKTAGKTSAKGFPVNSSRVLVLENTIDLAKVPTTNPAQLLGADTYATLVAADVVKALDIPKDCILLGCAMKVVEARGSSAGETSPTVGVKRGSTIAVTAVSLTTTSINPADGADWLTTGAVNKTGVGVTADTTLDLYFGGTLPTAPSGKVKVVAWVARI